MKTRIIAVLTLACLLLVAMTTAASAEEVNYGASLTGAAEVGEAGGDADGSGIAAITVDTETNEVCFDITVANVDAPNAAHIHVGGAGTNGGVVVNLDWPTNNGSGCVTSDVPTLAAIQNAPSLYYVNVHNEEFPGGAVRGQLSVAAAPADSTGDGGGELAFTGSNLTTIFAAAGGALVASGALMVRSAAKRRRV